MLAKFIVPVLAFASPLAYAGVRLVVEPPFDWFAFLCSLALSGFILSVFGSIAGFE